MKDRLLVIPTPGSLPLPMPCTGSFKVGTQSRSLTAAHLLVESGKFGSIKVLKGGVNGWTASERPIEEL